MQENKQRGRRAMAIALALVAAAGLIVAAFTDRWLASPDYEEGIGLRAFELCEGRCATGTNFELVEALDLKRAMIIEANRHRTERDQVAVPRPPWHGFPIMGLTAFIASLIAAAGLAIAAAVAITGKRIGWPVMPTTLVVIGLLFAIVTGCVFVATKPEMIEGMGVGWGFISFGGALVVGLAAVFPLNRQIRWFDPELGAASATMSWGSSRDEQ